MAMDGDVLGALIKSKIIAEVGGPPTFDAELTDFCNALGEAIVEHIQTHAVVTTSGADPQGGTVNSTGTVA